MTDASDTSLARGDAEHVDLLLVSVGSLRCAIRATEVAEVLPLVWVEPLAGAAAFVEGVIDLRGSITPVIDLAERFGCGPSGRPLGDHLLVVEVRGRKVALHVGAEVDMESVPSEQISAERIAEAPRATGVARLDDGFVFIHDVDGFLSSEEAVVLDEVLLARQVAE